MKVVSKYVDSDDWNWINLETPDGDLHFSITVSDSFYDEHDVGDSIEITVYSGALGYKWVRNNINWLPASATK